MTIAEHPDLTVAESAATYEDASDAPAVDDAAWHDLVQDITWEESE